MHKALYGMYVCTSNTYITVIGIPNIYKTLKTVIQLYS